MHLTGGAPDLVPAAAAVPFGEDGPTDRGLGNLAVHGTDAAERVRSLEREDGVTVR